MARINVIGLDYSDGILGWFDSSTAEYFCEDTRWDGNNHISVNSGSWFVHEGLYRTAGGRWVLNRWSQWQGTVPSYEFVSGNQASRWLLLNAHDAAVERFFGPISAEKGP